MTETDLPRLSRWRAEPHVMRWWGAPEVEREDEKLRDPRIAMWIAELDGRAIGFIQDYDVHGRTRHPFAYLPPRSRGMDVYIGEPDLLGRGHGSRMVRRHVEQLFERGAPAIGIDPHPDNTVAIRAFAKAGFRYHAGPLDTRWGRAVLMDQRAATKSRLLAV